MSIGEIAGYIASALVFATFYMKTMMRLRIIAIVSNIAFIAYALFEGLLPVLILHTSLLPLNIIRLREFARLVERTRAAARGEVSFETLLPFMTAARAKAGETLFLKGDHSQEMYYLCEGRIRLPEIGKLVEPGETLGEIGLFSPDRARTTSAVCETDCELLCINEEKFLQLYNQNPRFGFYVVRVITSRLIENFDRVVTSLAEYQKAEPTQGTLEVGRQMDKLDESRPTEPKSPPMKEGFGRRRRMRSIRTAALFTTFLVFLALAWKAAPYIQSLIIRDGVVTTWSNLATAPIDGRIRFAEAPLNQPVGDDGIVAEIYNDHLSRATIDAARIQVERARDRVREMETFLSEIQTLDDDRGEAKARYADEFRNQLDTDIVNLEAEIATAKLQLGVMKQIAERSARLAALGTVPQNEADESKLRVTEIEVRIAGMESDLRAARTRRKAANIGTFITGDGADPNWVFDWRMDLKVAKKTARLELREAHANLATAEVSLDAALTDFERQSFAPVKVPPGSIVWTRRVASGATIRAGNPVIEWIDCSILLVDVPVLTIELPLIRSGMTAEVLLDGESEVRTGNVALIRGSTSNFTRKELVAIPTDRHDHSAEVMIDISAERGDFEACPVGRSVHVDFPDVSPFDVIGVWLRL